MGVIHTPLLVVIYIASLGDQHGLVLDRSLHS